MTIIGKEFINTTVSGLFFLSALIYVFSRASKGKFGWTEGGIVFFMGMWFGTSIMAFMIALAYR